MNCGRIGIVTDTGQCVGGKMETWIRGSCDYGATRIRASSTVP